VQRLVNLEVKKQFPTIRILPVLVALALGTSFARAAVIANFAFTDSTLAPTSTDSGVTVSNLSTVSTTSGAGSGFVTNDTPGTTSGSPTYSQTGFDGGGYFTFTVTPNAGQTLSLSQFDFFQRLGSTGANRTYTVEYAVNGGALVQVSSGNASTLAYTQRQSPLSGEAALQNLTSSDTVEFRINGSLIGADATTFRIDDLVLTGVVPEPSTLSLLALAGACLVGRRRRA